MDLVVIQKRICEIKGYKIMFDFDLAELYGVETRVLKQSVRRNLNRFPEDFMFQLNKEEWQKVITDCDNLPNRVKFSPATPFAFTEHGVAMLSSILNSDKAIEVNISIMRVFTMVRQVAMNYKELQERIAKLEKQYKKDYRKIYQVFQAMLEEPKPEEKSATKIGYRISKSTDSSKTSSKK